jgi:nitrogen fixation protein FixH
MIARAGASMSAAKSISAQADGEAKSGGHRKRELSGGKVLAALIAFFAVVAGVNAIMIWLAISTFGGVETENSYQAGLAFAQELATVEAQDALHWQVRGRVLAGSGATVVEVTALDASDQPLAGLRVVARLAHPADRRQDHAVALHEEKPGQFRGTTDPVAGQWVLVIELVDEDGRLFRSTNRIFMR